jgi:hypothetical protein
MDGSQKMKKACGWGFIALHAIQPTWLKMQYLFTANLLATSALTSKKNGIMHAIERNWGRHAGSSGKSSLSCG